MHTVLTELETTDIPLHKLRAWEGNVRITGTDRRLDELTASMAAHGVLHSLVVQKKGRGPFTVIAGRRRLWALTRLAETGVIPRTYPVPCRVAPAEADPTEISLAENVEHEPMHPADEFEAFQKLIAQGQSAADVAARFGVSETVVQKRLALARVSPKLLAKYRAGEMNLELLQAFTLTDDHTRQEELWESLPAWNRHAAAIRRCLSEADLPATDRRVRFVGLAAYEAAGGRVRRNLFAEGEEGVSLLDTDLVFRLADKKLADLAEQVKADGWKWAAIEPEATYETLSRYRQVSAPEAPWTPEEEAHLAALQEERRSLEGELAEEAENEEQEPLYRRLEEMDRAVRSFTRRRKRIYSDLQKANSGVLVSIGFDGEPEYVYGLLRKEDERAWQSPAQTSEHTEEEPAHSSCTPPVAPEKDRKDAAAYSAALLESLTTHKTAALAAELTQQPTVALAAVVHALALQEFRLDWQSYGEGSSLQLSSRTPSLAAAESSSACLFLAEQRQTWFTQLPSDPGELWQWCLRQDQDTLLRLLAFCAARSVNAIRAKAEWEQPQRLAHANAIGTALHLEMRKWFTPTADNFFSRISKAQIIQSLAEAGTPLMVDSASLKKAELAARAEKAIAKTEWLPELLRLRRAGEAALYDAPDKKTEDQAA